MIQDRSSLPVGQGHPYLRNREALERMQRDMDALWKTSLQPGKSRAIPGYILAD